MGKSFERLKMHPRIRRDVVIELPATVWEDEYVEIECSPFWLGVFDWRASGGGGREGDGEVTEI